MNHEELKMILDTIASISGDASTAAIWWMALHYGVALMQGVLIAAIVLGTVYTIARASLNASEWAEIGRRIVKAYGGRGGYCVFEDDKRAIDKAYKKAAED